MEKKKGREGERNTNGSVPGITLTIGHSGGALSPLTQFLPVSVCLSKLSFYQTTSFIFKVMIPKHKPTSSFSESCERTAIFSDPGDNFGYVEFIEKYYAVVQPGLLMGLLNYILSTFHGSFKDILYDVLPCKWSLKLIHFEIYTNRKQISGFELYNLSV